MMKSESGKRDRNRGWAPRSTSDFNTLKNRAPPRAAGWYSSLRRWAIEKSRRRVNPIPSAPSVPHGHDFFCCRWQPASISFSSSDASLGLVGLEEGGSVQTFKTFLVGIDLHEGSAGALQSALRIGAGFNTAIHALYVIDELLVHDLQAELKQMKVGLLDSLKADAQSAWKQFTQDMPEAESVSFNVQIAHPAAALAREAGRLQADLLWLGTQKPGRVGATELEMACLRKSPCNVLIARQVHPQPFTNIVACVDFSEHSSHVLDLANKVASMENAKLTALHVFHGPWHKLHYRAPTPEASPKFEREYVEMLNRRLEEFARTAGVARENVLLTEHPHDGDGIIREVRRLDADLVVVGSLGRSRLADMLMGRTAEYVLRNTSCSVMVIKSDWKN